MEAVSSNHFADILDFDDKGLTFLINFAKKSSHRCFLELYVEH